MINTASTGPPGYLTFALGGVQDFIGAARRTADLWAGSLLMSHLSRVAQDAIGAANVVLPARTTQGSSSNRIFAEVPSGNAAALGRLAENAVRAEWQNLASALHGTTSGAIADALATFPEVRWVAWDGAPGSAPSYADAWQAMRAAMNGRGHVHDFPAYAGPGRQVCSLCGRRDSSSSLPARLRLRRGEELCPVCAVKRDHAAIKRLTGSDAAGFPSTASIASAPFRARAVDAAVAAGPASPPYRALVAHREAVRRVAGALKSLGLEGPGDVEVAGALPALERRCAGAEDLVRWTRIDGDWCYPASWDHEGILRERARDRTDPITDVTALAEACEQGQTALANLRRILQETTGDERPPATYLALVHQDGDSMGRRLSEGAGGASPDQAWHRSVSQALASAAQGEQESVEQELGRAVYTGGDDLLGLVPLVHALPAARRCRVAFSSDMSAVLPAATASTAVVYFHVSYPLQEALRRGRAALEGAKEQAGKDRLAVVVLRRGGERARVVAPWSAVDVAVTDVLNDVAKAFGSGLSPRLLHDLHRERDGLAALAGASGRHHQEVRRLVGRHGGDQGVGDLVMALEPAGGVSDPKSVDDWVDALQVALFLDQEGR